jgi:hypothetical protein
VGIPKTTPLACAAFAVLCLVPAAAGQNDAFASDILAMERKALDGFQTGDPNPSLAIADPEITYFHAITGKRVDGLPALQALFDNYRGRSLFDTYEMAGPKLQIADDTAVLTYVLVRHVGSDVTRWNSTQVYQRKKEGWRVIHSHWSVTAPSQQ